MLLRDHVDDADKLINVLIADGDLHTLSAQHIGRAHQHGITQLMGRRFSLLSREYGAACRSGDIALLQDGVKQFPVLRSVHILCSCAKNGDSHFHQSLRQLDGRLSAELHHRAVRFLYIHNALHILRCQRFKVQLIRNVEVRTYGLRVIVHDNGLIAFPAEGPGAVHGAEVKLNALSNADGTGTQNQNLFAALCLLRLVEASKTGIIVRRLCRKLSRAGVNHLVSCADVIFIALFFDLFLGNAGQPCDHVVRELDPLGLFEKLCSQFRLSFTHCLQGIFHLHKDRQLVDKPHIDLGNGVDLFIRNASAQRFRNPPDPHVIHLFHLLPKLTVGESAEIVGQQAVHMLFQGTNGFHQAALEVGADAHHLSGGLHLGSQGALGADEFIKWKPWHLDHTVVQHRLKACVCFFCNRVLDLIQGVAQGDLGRHLGNGVSGGLAGQSGRTAHTRVYLDHAVLKAVRVQGVLHIAAAGDPQLADNVEGGGTKHLVLLVPQCLGGGNHDTVAGVHAHGIDIFHITNRDHVTGAVPHHLILDFLPAGNAALHQNLSHT